LSTYLILSIVVGLVALGVAVMLSNAISAANAGTARMKEIAGYIHEGAMAFLYREYKYLAIFIVVVAAIIATFLSVSTALCFIGGASAYGGTGTVPGVIVGAVLMGVINLGMSLMGVDQNMQKVVKGLVLLAAVIFDVVSKRGGKLIAKN